MKTKMTHIGYYDRDEFGSYGWWEEGISPDDCEVKAKKNAVDSGFGLESPKLEIVKISDLSGLTGSEFENLASQWGLARANNWTSPDVDAEIIAEWKRREEPAIGGKKAAGYLNEHTSK